jgi:hypothetical protein
MVTSAAAIYAGLAFWSRPWSLMGFYFCETSKINVKVMDTFKEGEMQPP